MWLGVCIITIAMLIAASPTMILNPPPSDGLLPGDVGYKDPRVGIVLVIVGCIAQGFQCKSILLILSMCVCLDVFITITPCIIKNIHV